MQVSDRLRKACRECGLSINAIGRRADLSPSVVLRFMRGGGLQSPATDALAEALGLELTPKAPKGRKAKR